MHAPYGNALQNPFFCSRQKCKIQEHLPNQILSLVTSFFQKEKAFNREMKRKLEEMKATTTSLRTQKIEQKTKLKGLEATIANLKKTQKELEAALTEKDSQINQMEEAATNLKKARKELEATLTEKDRHIRQMDEKATNAMNTKRELEEILREKDSRIRRMEEKAASSNPDQMAALMEILQHKEAELEEIKTTFQDYKKTDRVAVNSMSAPVQTNNTRATPDIVVVKKPMNSSSVGKSEEKRSANTTVVKSAKPEEKRSANTTVAESAKPEVKRSANTTVVESAKPEENRSANTTVVESAKIEVKKSANTTMAESKHPKNRSLEENPVKLTTDMEDVSVQGNLDDFDEDIDFDDIYGESHSKKSGPPRRNKKFLTNNVDGIGQSGNSLDQDSDRVRYNRLLEKENAKLAKETKKNNTNAHAGHTISEKAVQGMAGAADVKPSINMPLNNDEARQQNRKQKKKKSKSKKKKAGDTADTNIGGEVAKQRTPDGTLVSK